MIGRYYDAWGTKQNILYRYGDNKGNPYPGPVQLSYYTNTRFFVLSKNQVITLQNTMTGVECHLCPIEDREKFEDSLFQAEIDCDDWAKKYLESETGHEESNPNRTKSYNVYLDLLPLAISCIIDIDYLFILDQRNLVKVYDIQRREIIQSFGKTGLEMGEFSNVTSIHACRIGTQIFILVGDAGSNQRLHMFTVEGFYLTSIGSRGPLLGQFRDISSISSYIPPALTDPSIDFYHEEYVPSWYKDKDSYVDEDEIQDLLVREDQLNNFIVAEDKVGKEENLHYVYFFNREKAMCKIPIRHGEVIIRSRVNPLNPYGPPIIRVTPLDTQPVGKKPTTPRSRPLSSRKSIKSLTPRASFIGNDVSLKGKRKEASAIDQSAGVDLQETVSQTTGYYLIEPERFDDGGESFRVYESIYDLIRHRKDLFQLREEVRDSFPIAVCDRKNFRVQIFRGFWTQSKLYSSFLLPIQEIGGNKNRYCRFQDPTDVSYTKGGELAVCDNGLNHIVLLSPVLEVIKTIQITYLSAKHLQLEIQQKKEEEEAAINSTSKSGSKQSVFVDEIRHQFVHNSLALVPTNAESKDVVLPEQSQPLAPLPKPKKVNKDSQLEQENMKKPCSVAFNDYGNMAVGFKSGGIYIYQRNVNSRMGTLEKLEIKTMEKIILEYLSYPEIELLRNTCIYFHNFTRELRLTYRIFPLYRQKHYNLLISLFFKYARIGREGLPQLANYELKDKFNRLICPFHLQLLCPLKPEACNYSHETIFIHRKEVNLSGAYITYEELVYFVSNLFHPKFLWKYEVYLQALFDAFSYEELIVIRQGALHRPANPFRDKVPIKTRVINFLSYLEIMVLLEEQLHGYKALSAHKLFTPTTMKRFLPKVPTNLDSIENPLPIANPLDQYTKTGINVPPTSHFKSKHIISKRGYEDAQRQAKDDREEHIEAFRYHTERAAALLDKLFI